MKTERHIQPMTKETQEIGLGIDDSVSNKYDAKFFTFLSGVSIGGSLCSQNTSDALGCFGAGVYFAIPALYLGLRARKQEAYQTVENQ